MKIKTLLLFLVTVLIGLATSCMPINPNWSPEQQARAQSANAQMVGAGAFAGLAVAGAVLAAKAPNYGGYYGGPFYGVPYYGYDGPYYGRYHRRH